MTSDEKPAQSGVTPVDPKLLRFRFSETDADQAFDSWGCNCGPAAFAAICDLTLEEARTYLEGFDQKRYTNPTMMADALNSTGIIWRRRKDLMWPNFGLVRIQWHGPWMKPEVPMRARYRYTHWIGAARGNVDIGVFDVNCLNSGGWVALSDWTKTIAPYLTAAIPRADGEWSVTHSFEVIR